MTDETQVDDVQETSQPADDPQLFTAEYVKDLRSEAAEWRTKVRDLEKQLKGLTTAQEKAKQKELAEQGKYQELFNEAAQQVQELEPLKGKLEAYESALKTVLEAQRATVPENIQRLLDKLDPVDQLTWLAENSQPQQPDHQGPVQLQKFQPQGGDPPKLSDQELVRQVYKGLGQGVGPFG